MSNKCVECGHIFEEGEQARWSESRGEFWGVPCSEEMSGCPLCHGGYEKTKPCKICGSEHLEEKILTLVMNCLLEKQPKLRYTLCWLLCLKFQTLNKF